MRILRFVLLLVVPLPLQAQNDRALMVDEVDRPRDITADRGFFVATGRAAPAWTGYVSLSYFWTPALTVGLPRVTLTVGSPLWTVLDGGGVAFASVKGQVVAARQTAWSVGAFVLGTSGVEAVWPYVAGTVEVDGFTFSGLGGVGVGNIGVFETDLEGDLLIQGAVSALVTPHVKLLGEFVQIYHDGDPGVLLGTRLFGTRWAIDVAAAASFAGTPSVLPWVSVAVGW